MSEEVPKVGSLVEVVGKEVKGKVAYIGATSFAPGKWFGVILDVPKGKNNGIVQDKVYFTCPDNHGIFVRQKQLTILENEGSSQEDVVSSSPYMRSLKDVSQSKSTSTSEKRRKSFNKSIPRIPFEKGSRKSFSGIPTPVSSSTSLTTSMIENVTNSSDTLSIKDVKSSFEFKGHLVQKDQEIYSLKSEIRDLNETLETIKLKRSEDQSKLKEAEKTKLQVQQLLEYKSKISEVQANLQRQLTQAKKEAKDAIESKEQHAEEMSDLAEAMEMATLDKEMAEEKCEVLQSELEQTKEKLEELQIDYEIMKAETTEKISEGGAVTTYQVKQLEQQNERLKEALVKLRDLSAQEKQEQQRLQKEFDQQKSEICELTRAKAKLSSLVDGYEKQLGELKEQVDATLGYEEMIELLTERNIALEDNVKELHVLVDDLERLQDVNDQLQESAKETELELREEVDMARVEIREGQRKMKAMQEVIVNHEQTIQKFRIQAEQLREANIGLHIQLQKEADKLAMSKPVEYFDFKVKYAETKAFARAIDIDLSRLEVQDANQHVNYLCAFMPDNFLIRGSDHDAILVLLLVPRLVAKSEVLESYIKEKFSNLKIISRDFVLKTRKIDQYSFSNSLLYQLNFLQSLLHQYTSALNQCNVKLLMKIGTFYLDMAVQEKALDHYVDLLRKDQLDEHINLDPLVKCVMYFFNLYRVHLSSEHPDCTQMMADHMKLIGAACDAIHTDITSIRVLLDNAGENSEFGNILKEVCTYADDVLKFVKKIRRYLPTEESRSALKFSSDIRNLLDQCREHVGKVMSAAYMLRKSTVQQAVMTEDTTDSFVNIDKIEELAYESTRNAYGKDSIGPECLLQSMSLVVTSINTLQIAMQEGEYEIEKYKSENISPIYIRAQAVKEYAKNLENFKFIVEALETDLLELKIALKAKVDELSEMHVRKEMAEKKLENATKDWDEKANDIQRQLDEANILMKNKEKEYERTLDHLQLDIDSLEKEKEELESKINYLEDLSKTTPVNFVASSTSPTVLNTDSSLLSQQVLDLQLALEYLKNENVNLQNINMRKQLASLPPLRVPSKSTGLSNATGFTDMLNVDSEEIFSISFARLSQKSKQLLEKAILLSCPTIVDISKCKPGEEPIIEKMSAKNHLVSYNLECKSLQNETEKLKQEVATLRAAKQLGSQINTDFTTFPAPDFSKTLSKNKKLISRITIPSKFSKAESAAIPICSSMNEIKKLHAQMLS